MRNYISIILGLLFFSLVACTDDNEKFAGQGGKVVISAKAMGATITRAIADTDPESTLAWVDVYVMNENKQVVYSERIDKSASPVVGGGEFVLERKREDFTKNAKFYIYLIANSTSPLSEATSWDELKKLTQRDEHLHLSGITGIENLVVPKYFLMDGFAYVPANNGVAPEAMTAYVINDGTDNDDFALSGTLKRAAAKIMIKITQGDNVEFKEVLDGSTPLYSYYQLPISTLVATPEGNTAFVSDKQNTNEWGIDNRNQSFNFKTVSGNPVINLVAYAYANNWKNKPENESSLLINIPMMWNKDGSTDNSKEAKSPVNWYEIPLSKEQKFERNKCYIINININAIGAEEQNTPIVLKDIEYITLDWEKVSVDLGSNEARYLTLNTDIVKIYDSNFDLEQLTFTSSSPIKSIKLKDTFKHNESKSTSDAFKALELIAEATDTTEAVYEPGDNMYAYYIDKFGQKVQLGTDPGFDLIVVGHTDWTKQDILNREAHLMDFKQVENGTFVLGEDGKPVSAGLREDQQYIRAVVPDDQKRALNGNIYIYSPINAVDGNDDLNWDSHFNTVRYLEFEVMNEQGLTATFRVEQTPVTVIRNNEGFFSYRSDFCIANVRQHYNYDAFAKNFPILPMGATKPVDKYGPHHYLNPREPFWAVAVFIPYHVHECDSSGQIFSATCGTIDKNNATNGELVYGLVHSSRDYYRSHGPDAGVFHRDHYLDVNGNNVPNESTIKNGQGKYYQSIGLPYKDEITGKYYRRHYVGQAQATFWSKYVMKVYAEDAIDSKGNVTKKRGLADIALQVPDEKASGEYYYVANGGANKSLVNHRMYNVRVTATSTQFTVAVPKMMDEDGNPTNDRSQGYTMEGEDNAMTVSPSFTIASQLGSTSLPVNEGGYSRPGVAGFYEYAKHQCREYVETRYVDVDNSGDYTPGDEVYHYDDWRLPTKAEVAYIVQQQTTSRAMDKVMNAQYYFVASTKPNEYTESTVYSMMVENYDANYAGHFMRCVRDAFEEPAPVKYDQNFNITSGHPVKSN